MKAIFFLLILVAIISPCFFLLENKARRIVLGVSLMTIVSLMLLYIYQYQGAVKVISMISSPSIIGEYFYVHPYSRFVAFGFIFIGSMSIIYCLETSKPSEQIASLLALVSTLGIVFSANYIVMFFFWEMLTLTTSSLIFLEGSKKSYTMGLRFMFMQLSGGLFLLFGILKHYAAVGSFTLVTPEAGLIFFIIGIGIKSSFLPFHFWLPWGYPAASFSSSVLLSILTTKIGVYSVTRILPSLDFLPLMGGTMAIFGVCMAILQKDLRKLLSYHVISQVGYMIAAVGMGVPFSVDGGFLHLFNHMIYKSLLFMSAGALIFVTGKENMKELQHNQNSEIKNNVFSVLKSVPLAAISAVIGALAISGVPPFNGYVSKYLLKYALTGNGIVEIMLFVAGIGTALSLTKFVYFGFIASRIDNIRPLPFTMKLSMITMASLTLIYGLWPELIKQILPYSSSLNVYNIGGLTKALIPVTLGFLLFLAGYQFLHPSRNYDFLKDKFDTSIFSSRINSIKGSVSAHLIHVEGLNNVIYIFLIIKTMIILLNISRINF